MPEHRLEYERSRLEYLLKEHTQNAEVDVRPYGKHLNVQLPATGGSHEVIARATEVGRNQFTAYFRNHAQKWEPLPIWGTLPEVAKGMADLLGPYFTQTN